MASQLSNQVRARRKKEQSNNALLEGLTALASVGLAAASAWIVYSNLAIDHAVPMPDAIDAARKSFESSRSGRLSYYVDRQASGRPLVLIHSVNAAASSYEMSPLFNYFREQRPVYALDLPGFGFSERSQRSYSPQVYTQAILDFVMQVVGEPVDVVALSLGSEFVARAALQQPDWFHSLALMSPTGFNRKREKPGSQQASDRGISSILRPLFAFPLWGRAFYDLLATRASIHYFLQKSFIGPVPTDLVEYDYITGHQPGAQHAPFYFISGVLFTPNVRQKIYEQVSTPTLVIYDRDNFTSFETLPELLGRNPHWQAVRILPTLGLAQFERLPETVHVLEQFWGLKKLDEV
jgi:pimeloyl-ACP methyl ester carboxylesterase